MSPLEELLLELEGELNKAQVSADWLHDQEGYHIDVQFLCHHITSAITEVRYLAAQETPS